MIAILEFAFWAFRSLCHVFIRLPICLLTPTRSAIKIPPINDDILLLPAAVLAEKIRTRQLTSRSVVEAYIARIKEINPIINAVVDDRFDLALEDAKRVDRIIANVEYTVEDLSEKFPLLGIPVSVKESIAVSGLSHNAGLKCSREKAKEDADVIKLIKKAGAIPLVVSNTPELCLNWETFNNVTGRTLNPYDTNRTPGGSSGGEAALIASGCSIIGIGSDVAGSLRLPAHFCGVWGHKTSPGTVSLKGHYPDCTDSKQWKRIFTLGPMTRYASDMPLLLRVLTDSPGNSHDGKVDLAKLSIFYMVDNGGLICEPVDKEIVKAIRRVATHFSVNHKAQTQKMYPKKFNYVTISSLLVLLGTKGVGDIFEGDSKKSTLAELMRYFVGRSDHCWFSIVVVMVQRILHFMNIDFAHTQLTEVSKSFRDKLGENGVLICPTFPKAAHRHNLIYAKVTNVLYMSIFNYLGLPVTNCPVGLNRNGLPIGVQVVANRNCDRLTIAVAQEIEKVFGGWIPPHKAQLLKDVVQR